MTHENNPMVSYYGADKATESTLTKVAERFEKAFQAPERADSLHMPTREGVRAVDRNYSFGVVVQPVSDYQSDGKGRYHKRTVETNKKKLESPLAFDVTGFGYATREDFRFPQLEKTGKWMVERLGYGSRTIPFKPGTNGAARYRVTFLERMPEEAVVEAIYETALKLHEGFSASLMSRVKLNEAWHYESEKLKAQTEENARKRRDYKPETTGEVGTAKAPVPEASLEAIVQGHVPVRAEA